ncbi:MAG: hypothetical protein [Bacteriophage sp.]|nr:MAG: hypothetical protein [Bacteriophage sp.]
MINIINVRLCHGEDNFFNTINDEDDVQVLFIKDEDKLNIENLKMTVNCLLDDFFNNNKFVDEEYNNIQEDSQLYKNLKLLKDTVFSELDDPKESIILNPEKSYSRIQINNLESDEFSSETYAIMIFFIKENLLGSEDYQITKIK